MVCKPDLLFVNGGIFTLDMRDHRSHCQHLKSPWGVNETVSIIVWEKSSRENTIWLILYWIPWLGIFFLLTKSKCMCWLSKMLTWLEKNDTTIIMRGTKVFYNLCFWLICFLLSCLALFAITILVYWSYSLFP